MNCTPWPTPFGAASRSPRAGPAANTGGMRDQPGPVTANFGQNEMRHGRGQGDVRVGVRLNLAS